MHFEETELIKFFNQQIDALGLNPLEIKVRARTQGEEVDASLLEMENYTKISAEIDRFCFKELVRNLVENAKRHGKIDGQLLEVDFLIVGDPLLNKTVTIVYMDNGKGLSEDFAFDDYKKFGEKQGESKGSGIGGYIIQEIVKMHNPQSGDLLPLSLSKGFAFKFNIPFFQNYDQSNSN
jgi:K+-sensing histidine kinase KdpD